MTYPVVIVGELCAGVAGGLVVGALRDFLITGRGAASVGFLAGVPVGVISRICSFGLHHWGFDDIVAILLVSLVMGAPVGYLIWDRLNPLTDKHR
ncbi:MAG: hypothetical protein ACJ796_14455 [Gemmatimonadaceae bacterium]